MAAAAALSTRASLPTSSSSVAGASHSVRLSRACRAQTSRRVRAVRVAAELEQREIVYNPGEVIERAEAEYRAAQQERPSSLKLFSPSKVNLFLRVTRRREDGFHDLASMFHAIDLGDIMKISLSPSNEADSLSTNSADLPLGKDNLVIKALDLFRERTGCQQYFWVHLEKRVPTGAGLGGGSGNAATALWAANEMCGRPATEAQLLEWSVDVGSDVPFFFSTGSAYCEGKGEVIRDVPSPLSLSTPLLLVKPPEGLPTGSIFKGLGLAAGEEPAGEDPEALLKRLAEEGANSEVCVNDLEPPAFEALPRLKQLKRRLEATSRGKFGAVFMSGSGSTIVCVGSDEAPQFLDEEGFEDIFVSPARMITRDEGKWYTPGTDVAELMARSERPPDAI